MSEDKGPWRSTAVNSCFTDGVLSDLSIFAQLLRAVDKTLELSSHSLVIQASLLLA